MMGHRTVTHGRTASSVLGATAAVAATVLALTSCSASRPHPARTHGATASANPGTKTAGTSSGAHQGNGQPGNSSPGQLGSSLAVSDSSGTELEVTLKKVVDPASGANSYSKPASGMHFVGIKLRVQNKALDTYQNNANNETAIVLSGGRTLHADYNPIANCGNFDNGQITLKSGAAVTGCVTFQVPKGQKVVQVSYVNTVFPGKGAEWRI